MEEGLDEWWEGKADLLSAQPVNQSGGVGHLATTCLRVILQVLLLFHGSIVKCLVTDGSFLGLT